MGKKLYQDRDWLYQKYEVEGLSLKAIAKITGTSERSGTTIHRWIKKFGFKPHKAIAPRERNFRWKGGSYISSHGYKYVIVEKNHPRGIKKGGYSTYIPEQYSIMEKELGRYLKSDEVIHHLNGDKLDNRIENLMLFSDKAQHHKFESLISKFVKQLIWGKLSPQFKKQIYNLFQEFVKGQ